MVKLTTDIAVIEQNTQLTPNKAFNEIMQQIPKLIKDADELINADIDTVDESQIEELQDKFKQTQAFKRNVESSISQIKKLYNSERDTIVKQINDALQQNQYDQVLAVDAKLKQLNKDKLARRKDLRWKEVNDIFDAALKAYPDIQRYAPALCDFSTFHLANPKLVSGAKTAKIGDKQREVVNQTLERYNEGIQQIKQNPLGLMETYQNQLLQAFIATPTLDTVHNLQITLKQRQDYEIKALQEQQKRLEEQKRLQEQQAQMQTQAKQNAQTATPTQISNQQAQTVTQPTPVQQPSTQPIQPTIAQNTQPLKPNQIKSTNRYEWLINYAFSIPSFARNPKSSTAKLNLISNIINQCNDPNSIVAKNTKLDADELVNVLKYILQA